MVKPQAGRSSAFLPAWFNYLAMNKNTKRLLIIVAVICLGLLIWFFIWYAQSGMEQNVAPDGVEATETLTQGLPAHDAPLSGVTLC